MTISKNTAELVIKAIDQASATLQRIGVHGSQSMSNVKKQTDMANKSLDYLKTAAVGAAVGFGAKGAWDWLVKSNAQMEQYRSTLNIVMKDTEKAAQTLDWATKFAAKTPFEIPQIVDATVKLQAYGMTAKGVLGDIGDMAAAMGKPLEQAVEAFADAQTGELERLKEFGITKNMLIAQAAKMGKGEIVNAQGQITDLKGMNETLIGIIKERYAGAMEAQSKTLNGMISNLKDWGGTAGRTLGEGMFEQLKPTLENAMSELNRLQQSGQLEKWGQSIGNAMEFAAKHSGDFLAVMSGFGTLIIITKSVEGLSIALTGLRTAETLAAIATDGLTKTLMRNPFGLVAVGISAVVGGLVAYKLHTKEATGATAGLTNEKANLIVQYRNEKVIVDSTTASDEEKARAQAVLNSISRQVPGIISDVCAAYGQEGIEIDNVTGKITAQTAAILNNLAVKRAQAEADLATAQQAVEEAQKLANPTIGMEVPDPFYSTATTGMEMLDTMFGRTGNTVAEATGFKAAEGVNAANEALGKTQEEAGKAATAYDLFDQACKKAEEAASKFKAAGVGGGIGSAGAAADKANKSLVSLGSAFSSVSSAIATGSGIAFVEAKDALQDIAAAAEKAGATDISAGIQEALSLLPKAVNDQTGKAGKQLLWLLYNIFNDSADMVQDAGYKIANTYDASMGRLLERLEETHKKAAEAAQKAAEDMQKALDQAAQAYADYNQRLSSAGTNYADNVASVNLKLKEDLADLRDDLKDQIDDIIAKYKEWIGLFDEAPKRQYVSATKLLRNLTEQNRQMKQFYDTLETISRRGVDSGLIDELKAMGPKALPQILALSRMTDAQLQQYVALWREKGSLAGDAASDEIEEAREEMLTSQQKMREDARKELTRLKDEYEKQMKEIKDDTEDTLKDMAKDAKEQGEKFVVNLLNGIKEKYPALAAYIDKIAGEMGIGGVSTSGTGTGTGTMTTAEKYEYIKAELKKKGSTWSKGSGETIMVMTGKNGEFTKFTYDEAVEWLKNGGKTSGGSPVMPSSGGTSGGTGSSSGSGSSGGTSKNPSYIFTSSNYKMIGDTAAILARNFENYGYTVGWDASTGKVLINGKAFSPLDIDSNDRAWVGLRSAFEAMGRKVEWDSSSGNVNVYHKGGQVSKLGPKEVPIIAEEGEIIFPNTRAAVNFERALEKHADRLIKAMEQRFNFTIEKLFAPENVNVNKESDWNKVSRQLKNDLLLAIAK